MAKKLLLALLIGFVLYALFCWIIISTGVDLSFAFAGLYAGSLGVDISIGLHENHKPRVLNH